MGSTYTKKRKPKINSKLKTQNTKLHIKKQKVKTGNNEAMKQCNNVTMKQCNNETMNKCSNYLIKTGLILIIFALSIFFLTFSPIIFQEINYQLSSKAVQKSLKMTEIKPVDEDFGIVIPKIKANAKVTANVDPFNPVEYQRQLTKGVAHAKGSVLPNKQGNVFLFAHSTDNWYNANRYNAVFYLINKLEKDDEIIIYYKKTRFLYKVTAKKLVEASTVSYLSPSYQSGSVLTLMTCWPPGTTLKRLVITASLNN